jgi:hypothetical protein
VALAGKASRQAASKATGRMRGPGIEDESFLRSSGII